jgi:hypothetical protein
MAVSLAAQLEAQQTPKSNNSILRISDNTKYDAAFNGHG